MIGPLPLLRTSEYARAGGEPAPLQRMHRTARPIATRLRATKGRRHVTKAKLASRRRETDLLYRRQRYFTTSRKQHFSWPRMQVAAVHRTDRHITTALQLRAQACSAVALAHPHAAPEVAYHPEITTRPDRPQRGYPPTPKRTRPKRPCNRRRCPQGHGRKRSRAAQAHKLLGDRLTRQSCKQHMEGGIA
jgi:hypothetical protein